MNLLRQVRRAIRQFAWLCGFEITREPNLRLRFRRYRYGVDALGDIQKLLGAKNDPLICDVGANQGQSVLRFGEVFPDASIHAFEPSPTTFRRLASQCRTAPRVSAWNVAIGATNGTRAFRENTYSDMSSFLVPGASSWGEVIRETDVQITTLDDFADQQNVNVIDLLKSDTQGFELEVFKGAQRLMAENRIRLIFCEVIFSEMYEGLPSFYELLRFLDQHNFRLVGVYEQHFTDGILSWADLLFVNRAHHLLRASNEMT